MSELSGIGVGRGIAAGPVRRMPDPLPVPDEKPYTGDVDAAVAATVVVFLKNDDVFFM